MTRVVLSLVSHTNVGKTTLARTLLGRDVGEVRDEAHVTWKAETHLLCTAGDDELVLADTPGFGDSARLAARMRREGTPLGWLLTQVWDRWRDRGFWHSQQALRHVRAESDVVLYLLDASAAPGALPYLAAELEILRWIGKPVLVLLNQTGQPRPPGDEDRELAGWREHLAGWPLVREVLPLDAFARCWVQELTLSAAIVRVLDGAPRAAMQRLEIAWQRRLHERFDAAMATIADSLARIAATRIELDDEGVLGGLRRRVGLADGPPPAQRAHAALVEALAAEVQRSTDALIQLHQLPGRARAEVIARAAALAEASEPLAKDGAAAGGLLAGAVSGALAGLHADLLSGGLSLGLGALAGGALGALAATRLASGIDQIRGTDRVLAVWPEPALRPLVEAALLRYLAVAHFGRGRGDWVAAEAPAHWAGAVAAVLDARGDALAQVWRQRAALAGRADAAAQLAQALQPELRAAALLLLRRLYPAAAAALAARDKLPP